MAYCTLDDIKNVIPERQLINLTNDNPSVSSVVDEKRFEAVCKDADSLINGYLRARYNLPLKIIPQTITQIAIDVCAYRIYLRRPETIPEHIVKNYDRALTLLVAIQKGNFILETASEVTSEEETNITLPAVKSVYRINRTKKDKIFTDNLMKTFRRL